MYKTQRGWSSINYYTLACCAALAAPSFKKERKKEIKKFLSGGFSVLWQNNLKLSTEVKNLEEIAGNVYHNIKRLMSLMNLLLYLRIKATSSLVMRNNFLAY